MSPSGKRIPGQSNAGYENTTGDPNADFQGTHSLYGGGDPSWSLRLVNAIGGWRKRRKNRKHDQP